MIDDPRRPMMSAIIEEQAAKITEAAGCFERMAARMDAIGGHIRKTHGQGVSALSDAAADCRTMARELRGQQPNQSSALSNDCEQDEGA